MKKIVLAMLAIVLTGCSALQNIPFLQTPGAAQNIVNSPVPTVTLLTSASSNTPDLFVINTEGPTSTPPTGAALVTKTPVPSFTPTTRPTITLEPVDIALFTPGPKSFHAGVQIHDPARLGL